MHLEMPLRRAMAALWFFYVVFACLRFLEGKFIISISKIESSLEIKIYILVIASDEAQQ